MVTVIVYVPVAPVELLMGETELETGSPQPTSKDVSANSTTVSIVPDDLAASE